MRRLLTAAVRALAIGSGFLTSVVAALAIVAWLTGRIVSDRYEWSQWLLWIPTPAAGLAAIAGLVGALRPVARRRLTWRRSRRRAATTDDGPRGRAVAGFMIADVVVPRVRRRRVYRWLAVCTLMVTWFSVIEHRMLHRADPHPDGLKVVHWNLTERLVEPSEPLIDEVIRLDGEITILTAAGTSPWTKTVREWLGEENRPRRVGPFTVLTRLPVMTMRWLVSGEDVCVALLIVDTTERLGRPLVAYLVDLPSDPKQPRAKLAAAVRSMLDAVDAPAPDLIVGDFNITRGSASLRRLFPGARHAFDEAGHGYGATFHAEFPLYHIDHILLGPNAHADRYDVETPKTGRHLAQTAWIVLAESDGAAESERATQRRSDGGGEGGEGAPEPSEGTGTPAAAEPSEGRGETNSAAPAQRAPEH